MTTAAEAADLKTYWCHECDMSVSLTLSPSPSPLLCPHCNTNFLELMDSPFPLNDAASSPFTSLFDSPLFHQFILTTNPNDAVLDNENENDVVRDPLLSLLSPTSKSKPRAAESVPLVIVTSSLLFQLDSNGVVSCAVCKDDVSVDDEAKILPCNHLYHSDCITPWLVSHDSCPLCRFRLVAEEGERDEDGDGDGERSGEIRRQLRAAMARLSELMEEEEEEDFYGLRTTLNHIASRHGILQEVEDSDGSGVSDESVIVSGGGGNEQLP
ncbi:hypothetical protein RIF29_38257 [Crotalaria pallida]|uniref:RING-type E3 ubiquitin transferase n=1 Tax=Crotalaria pallida TaxID=3830 RepID=A0AAN9E4D8_CROPI